jgi:hypothetical protein
VSLLSIDSESITFSVGSSITSFRNRRSWFVN